MSDDIQPLLVEIAVEPRSSSDAEKLSVALAKLVAEDRSFRVTVDPHSGQTIIHGTSVSHLKTKVALLERTYEVDANVGPPLVAYRETLTRPATVTYTYKKQTGGSGEYAEVTITAEPLPVGSTPDFVFENKIVDGRLAKEYVLGVEKGLESVLPSGVLAGFPVVDLKVSLLDGKYHDVDSSARAFEIAARMALREALRQGGAILLEPVMKVEVVAPADCVGVIIADLNSRRGQIQAQDKRGEASIITAMVPLANMFSYIAELPAICAGRGTFTMRFDHYAKVPLPEDEPPFSPAMAMRA
jgi:elongation factor G